LIVENKTKPFNSGYNELAINRVHHQKIMAAIILFRTYDFAIASSPEIGGGGRKTLFLDIKKVDYPSFSIPLGIITFT
jgi:hypothetical protein